MLKNLIQKAKSFGEAAITHLIEDGWQDLPDVHYHARLGTCSACEFKKDGEWVCGECGCDLLLKAKWPAMECPKGKWLKIPLNVVSDAPTVNNTESTQPSNCGCGT